MRDISFFKRESGFIFGMVHALPLLGTLNYKNNMEEIIEQAVSDAKTLEKVKVNAIIVENMGDEPFGINLDIPQITSLSVIAYAVSKSVSIPIGIDAAMNDYKTALSIAVSVGADFVRIPVFVDTVEFYGGIINPCAREAVIFRKSIGAENVKILADIQVKHTHMLLPHISVEESAKAAVGCGADGIIITGTHIGEETPIKIIKRIKSITNIPVIAGSGVKKENVKDQMKIADGAIIGSSFKKGGVLANPISYELAKELIDALKK